VEPTPQVSVFKESCPAKGDPADREHPHRMLDLFSGTGSIARVFADRGYEVTRLDSNARFDPDILVDILDWEYWTYPPGWFTVIAASPLH
jgi:hypothetical protein